MLQEGGMNVWCLFFLKMIVNYIANENEMRSKSREQMSKVLMQHKYIQSYSVFNRIRLSGG